VNHNSKEGRETMLHHLNLDPMHDRPPVLSADELRDGMQTVHGSLIRLERTACTPEAAGAFHAAGALVADLLWPVTA
jgi:hypothetical protein